MTPGADTTATTVMLRLSSRAYARLVEQAANRGQDISTFVSDLIENAITKPTVDEVLAPLRKQVAESGMSDEELDNLLRSELEAHRQEKRVRRS